MPVAMALVGRSSDLTGRTELWAWVVQMILKHPLLGYGFSGFWEGASPESEMVHSHVGWTARYSHNGYLEVALSLGLLGLVLLFMFMVKGIRRAVIAAEHKKSIQDLWPLAFLVFVLVRNMGECTMMWQNDLEWAICIATIVAADPRFKRESYEGDDMLDLSVPAT